MVETGAGSAVRSFAARSASGWLEPGRVYRRVFENAGATPTGTLVLSRGASGRAP